MTVKIRLHKDTQYPFGVNGNHYLLKASQDRITINGHFNGIYGLGERFNSVNHKGHRYENKVEEHFCHQQDKTYFPLPFFYTDQGWGIFINTPYVLQFEFTKDITVYLKEEMLPLEVHIIKGTPAEIIAQFLELTGKPYCPPKWALGPWISAHRWNSEELVKEQLNALKENKIPATMMVIEQWSDEATFYIFNGAKYEAQNQSFTYDDFTFDKKGLWPDPKV